MCAFGQIDLARFFHVFSEEGDSEMTRLNQKPLHLGQKGQGLTEYLMLVMLVAIVSLAIVKSIGTQVKTNLTTVRDNIMREIPIE